MDRCESSTFFILPSFPSVTQDFQVIVLIHVSVQFSSVTQSYPTLCNPMGCNTLGLPLLQLPKFTQTHVHWVSDANQPSHPLSSPSPAFIGGSHHWWLSITAFPDWGSFQMSHIFASGDQSIGVASSAVEYSNEYSGQISFRMDWLDLRIVQGTLKSFLQNHSSKHQFFGAQLSL